VELDELPPGDPALAEYPPVVDGEVQDQGQLIRDDDRCARWQAQRGDQERLDHELHEQ
jgi:hypothetical protein